MSIARIAVASCLIAPGPLLAEMAVHTAFEVRLLSSLSSYYSKTGDAFRAAVVAPVCAESGSSFPAGTVISGVVKSVHRVGLGLVHETAKLDLEFREVQVFPGQPQPIDARLLSVDNAREHVDHNGAIHGIRATASLSNRVGERLALAALGHPLGLIPMFIVESALLRFPDPEIDYQPGTDLHLELETPLSMPGASGCAERVSPLDRIKELQHIVAGLPYWTYTERQHTHMDPINLMFIGSEDVLNRAFASAGWTGSRSLSAGAGFSVIRAIAEDHGDADAPMRTLLLDNREPDMSRQKALNTFEKRHHIRVWNQPAQFDGAPVWAAAATWDVGTTFSFRFGFTHRVQNDIDIERDKVVGDFIYTGCVDQVGYVDRPEDVGNSEFRKDIWTDGRIAVVILNACDAQAPASESSANDRRPSLSVRYIRRFTLTVRNHFIRDNLIWRSGEGIYLACRAVRDWRAQRVAGRTMPVELSRRMPHPPDASPPVNADAAVSHKRNVPVVAVAGGA
jgi:LssY C-terminus